jgi:uncharacterized protein
MNRDQVIDRLRQNESTLRARGVVHAALIGSLARQEATAHDIDILVEFDPAARVTVFDYAGIKNYIAGLFDGPVDVVDREALKPRLRQTSARDAVYAF